MKLLKDSMKRRLSNRMQAPNAIPIVQEDNGRVSPTREEIKEMKAAPKFMSLTMGGMPPQPPQGLKRRKTLLEVQEESKQEITKLAALSSLWDQNTADLPKIKRKKAKAAPKKKKPNKKNKGGKPPPADGIKKKPTFTMIGNEIAGQLR